MKNSWDIPKIKNTGKIPNPGVKNSGDFAKIPKLRKTPNPGD